METKHTPGPWSARHLPNVVQPIMRIETLDAVICDCNSGTTEGTANTRLIAAAPELLAAAKNALPWLIKANNDGAFSGCALPLGGQKAIEQIQRAIAKATGQ